MCEKYGKDKDCFDHLCKECRPLLEDMIEIINFYADPATYFAIAVFSDPPCGEFIDDFSETDLGVKPGKMARDFQQKIQEFLGAADE